MEKLELGRRLYRQIGRFLPLENTIDITGCASKLVEEKGPVGNQAPSGDKVSSEIDCRQLVLGSKRDEQVTMNYRFLALPVAIR